MASPVKIPFESFITIDRSGKTAVYLQITQQMINAIQRGYLLVGSKLPGTRTLSQILQIHRQTVVAVYTELETQGWVESRPNKGTYIIYQSAPKFSSRPYDQLVSLARYPLKTGYTFKQSNVLDDPFESSDCSYHFNDGQPDYRLTQLENLSSLYSASLKRKTNRKKLGTLNREGSEYFREQLGNYLNLSRGLHVSKRNILITRSAEMSLYIIAQVLINPGDVVLVGNLSLFTANMIFQNAAAKLQTVPVDQDGISTDYIRQYLQKHKVRCIYITPNHHYPTTVNLSAQRRIELLQLAKEYGFAIIEDDFDFDFQYDRSAIMPLASGDVEGMVIYLGSFGKSLAPGFKAGFVVAPDNLIQELRKYMGIIDQQGDIMMEQVLGEMIEEGNIHRHLKKSLHIYRERRDLICTLLDEHFKDLITYRKPSGGLAVWTEWHFPVSLLKLSQSCATDNLFIPKNILYQNKQLTAMRIGFGHLNTREMMNAVTTLKINISKHAI